MEDDTDTMKTKTSTEHIRVDAQDDRQVVFHPLNEDRFVMTCQQAIEAVTRGIGESVREDELKGLIAHVRDWSAKNKSLVSSCHMALRDGQIAIFVATSSEHYNHELADSLTELDVDLARTFPYSDCDVAQIPSDKPSVLAAFMDEAKALCLYPIHRLPVAHEPPDPA